MERHTKVLPSLSTRKAIRVARVGDPTIKRLLVLVNESAGTLAKARDAEGESGRIRGLFAAQGVEAIVRSEAMNDLCDAAAQACSAGDFDAVIAGGGDGTLNAIAAVVAEQDGVFGVLPLGTHNHFAKDIGVPLDLEQAVAALARGVIETIPVGLVNGRLFLNFSSIGIHPEIVKHRDAQRKVLRRWKFWAMFISYIKMLGRFPLMRVRMAVDDQNPFQRVTPSVVIGNNAHQLRVFGFEGGHFEDRTSFSLLVARPHGRWSMVWLSIRAFFGTLEKAENFDAISARRVVIDITKKNVRVSIDGEVIDLNPPLKYELRQPGLRVLVPAKND